jgi:serine/threonine protein kinase
MNDLKAAELYSKSLSTKLSAAEKKELQSHQSAAPEVAAFANLSALIQKSVVSMTAQGVVEQSGERLSAIAKERMRRSIAKAKQSQSATSFPPNYPSELRVAESETLYFLGDQTDQDEAIEESRQAICRFTLLRKIGEGGLGSVWLARDEKLKRTVALKEMNENAAQSPKLWKRFQREAEITGHLEHPNVVPLYLSGVNAESGMPFYAMRFLGKMTLADAIAEYHARRKSAENEDPIHLHRLLNAFLDVCQAIAFAHSRGVIHRDLKPENVALDNFGQVLVLDWGLAKLDSDGELATRLALSGIVDDSAVAQTIDGDVVGTPLYMAPEQAAGEMSLLDERTDVYGLGAILFAILTGKAPHENSSRSRDGTVRVQELLANIVKSDAPKPREINASIPRDLELICLRAMSKNRFARQASAQELASEVESWIAGRNHRQTRYDSLRLTGRDLKSRLCVQIRQLSVTAQFMVELPPMQGLLANMNAGPEEFAEWRERLSKILLALARTKANLSGLSYCQVKDGRLRELVRIERSQHDVANIRALPQSRLRRGAANTFHKTIMEQFPGESYLDFDMTTAGSIRIVAGVPVFDAESEEPFGLVLAEAEVENLVRPEILATASHGTIYLMDDKDRILFSSKPYDTGLASSAADIIPAWKTIADVIAEADEFIDANHEFYANRLVFPQKNNSIRILLRVEN